MKTLPIADCRLPIYRLFAGRRLTGGSHDGSQSVGFFQQGGQLFCSHDVGLDQQFEPQGGFIGFFFDSANFGDEFSPAPCATRRAIIGGHRSSAANNLPGDNTASIVIFGNCPGQFNDPQSKGFGASLRFNWVHDVKLQIQSAIGDRQSAIAK